MEAANPLCRWLLLAAGLAAVIGCHSDDPLSKARGQMPSDPVMPGPLAPDRARHRCRPAGRRPRSPQLRPVAPSGPNRTVGADTAPGAKVPAIPGVVPAIPGSPVPPSLRRGRSSPPGQRNRRR